MAKQPKTTEHYEIKCRVEIDQLGQIIAALTKIGIAEIAHELVTNVRAFAQRRPKDDFAKDEVIRFTQDHPSFRLRDLAKHFRDNGRGDSAAYYAVKQLLGSGELKKQKDGQYVASVAKTPKKPAASKKGGKRQIYDVTNKDLIWRHVKARKAFHSSDLLPLFRTHKRNTSSISPQLINLVKENRIKPVPGTRGEYVVLKQDRTPTAPSLNGGTEGVSEATSNG